MSFSVEDVRAQLSKLGYENVPDQVIEKFMSRMKAQADDAAQMGTAKHVSPVHTRMAPPQQTQPTSPEYTVQLQPYAPAALPPPVTHASPFSNLPLSSPYYSSLAQPVTQHTPQSNLPGLPLSLRTNTAFTSAYQPAPVVAPAYAPPPAHDATTTRAMATTKKTVTIQDAATDEDDEDDDIDDRAYYERKEKEIRELEERLKRHAAIAHGVRSISRPAEPQVPVAHAAPPAPAPAPMHTSAAKENDVDPVAPARIGNGRGFGAARSENIPVPSVSAAFPMKPVSVDLALRAERELRARGTTDLQRSAAHRALPATTAVQPRSILRPSSARARRPSTARSAHAEEAEQEANVLEVVDIDTQRSLRKTYATSVKKFKPLNPRYGDGGYRKSDPVTRYHAFKDKWDNSHFLTKKTTTSANTSAHAKTAWKA